MDIIIDSPLFTGYTTVSLLVVADFCFFVSVFYHCVVCFSDVSYMSCACAMM